ncbi:uncharacterized protein [Temnothorax nylanderi]|uniref:uncharacterized protein n=1 Tax=Temnothorax nylanderi TaxID=102681 RepID=UPI003A8BCF9B
MATESLKAQLRRVQRLVAIRVACCYRTTSHAAASTLAGLPLMELLADNTRMCFGVLTGHGCFGEYLWRIEKEQTTQCHHCVEELDSAQHTLAHCPAWAEERRVLRASIGGNLFLPAIVAAIVGGEDKWRAMMTFCGTVMATKEEAERIRRGEQSAQDPVDMDVDGGVFRRPQGLPPRRRWRLPIAH